MQYEIKTLCKIWCNILNNHQVKGAAVLAYTYISKGKFELREKDKPVLQDSRDAIIALVVISD